MRISGEEVGADWFGAASAVYYAYQQVPHTKVAIELAGDDARIRKGGTMPEKASEDAWRSKPCAAPRTCG